MFNPTHPHITLPTPTGPLTRNIRPSFPANAAIVVRELNALFAAQADVDASTGNWRLEPTCDAISAFFALRSKEDVISMLWRVLDVAEQVGHHPSISAWEGAGGRWVVLVVCGTHQPAGLSVKDARLARTIGEVAGEVGAGGEVGDGMERLVEWHWRENMRRGRVCLDADVEGSEEEEGQDVDERIYWRLNTVEDVEAFVEGAKKEEAAKSDMPTLRGLFFEKEVLKGQGSRDSS